MDELFANLRTLRMLRLDWHRMAVPNRGPLEQRRYDGLCRSVESLLTDPRVSAAFRKHVEASYGEYFGGTDLSIKSLSFWDDYVSRLVRPAFPNEPYRNRLVYRLTEDAYASTHLAKFIVDEVNWDRGANWNTSRVAVLRAMAASYEWSRTEAILRDPAKTVILVLSAELDSPDETAFFTRLEESSGSWQKIVNGGSCFRCLRPRDDEARGLLDDIVAMNPIDIPLALVGPPER